jgi:succinate dehydrogenase / fumarate reductase, cytochrome b subunit
MESNTSVNLIHPAATVTTQRVAVSHSSLAFWHTMIGKKVIMAVTGVVLIGFVVAHMLGNLKIFSGADGINAYSRFLREAGSPELAYGQLLWIVRAVLLICVALHITAAVQLSRISWAARPVEYNVKRNVETTFAARMMRWGGVLLVAFIVFHLFHLTIGAVGFHAGQFTHLAVYQNVTAAFKVWPVALFYVVAMVALCLHLDHGIWSMLQTLGWNTARNERTLKIASRAIAIVVFLGFSSVPVSVSAGWLR